MDKEREATTESSQVAHFLIGFFCPIVLSNTIHNSKFKIQNSKFLSCVSCACVRLKISKTGRGCEKKYLEPTGFKGNNIQIV